MEFLEALQKATNLWSEIISGSFHQHGGCTQIFDFTDYRSVEQLNRLTELDATGLSTCFALWGASHRRMRSNAFTFEDIITRVIDSSVELAKSAELYNLLRHPAIFDVLEENSLAIRQALAHYKANEKTLELAEDFEALAEIREAAVIATNELQVHQFAWGEATGDASKVNPHIYRFMDVNGAVNAIQLCGQIGMTLAIISDNEAEGQEDLNSFFALFVYDGGTLTMLTDKCQWVHPRQSGMMRNDRHVLRRQSKSLFPYELLEMRFADDGRHAVVKDRKGLINFSFKMSRVKAIKDIEPASVIFIAMLLELAHKKYIRDGKRLPALSYTMSSVHQVAIESNEGRSTSLINLDRSAQLPMIEQGDVTHQSVEWDRENNHGFFKWAEDRYLPSMPAKLLNMYDDVDTQTRLLGDGSKFVEEDPDSHEAYFRSHRNQQTKNSLIAGMAAAKKDTFGTLAELADHQRWSARYNQARFVAYSMEREIKKEEAGLKQWIRDRVVENVDSISQAAASMEMIAQDVKHRTGEGYFDGGWFESMETNTNFCEVIHSSNGHYSCGFGYRRCFVTLSQKSFDENRCFYTGAKPTVFAVFMPRSPMQLAKLCGVRVDQMPALLQQYWGGEPYTGNSILEKIDPMDWVPQPLVYENLGTVVTMHLSKNAFNEIRKKYGLERFRDWKSLEKGSY